MKLSEVNDFDLQKFHQKRVVAESEISTQIAAALKIPRAAVATGTVKVTPRGIIHAKTFINIDEQDNNAELLGAEFYTKHLARILTKILKNNPNITGHEILETRVSRFPNNEAKYEVAIEFTFTL